MTIQKCDAATSCARAAQTIARVAAQPSTNSKVGQRHVVHRLKDIRACGSHACKRGEMHNMMCVLVYLDRDEITLYAAPDTKQNALFGERRSLRRADGVIATVFHTPNAHRERRVSVNHMAFVLLIIATKTLTLPPYLIHP